MRKLVLRLVTVAAVGAGAALAGGRADAAPVAPRAIATDFALAEPAQLIYRGKPYCWYPYGWAGAGWYWCGYGTHVGVGWGGWGSIPGGMRTQVDGRDVVERNQMIARAAHFHAIFP